MGDPLGNHDRTLDLSTATLVFVPTADFLDHLPVPPAQQPPPPSVPELLASPGQDAGMWGRLHRLVLDELSDAAVLD